MPVLAVFLGSIFSVCLRLFARFFVLEKAAKLAALSVALSLMAALTTAMMSCVTGICAVSITNMAKAHQAVAMGLGIAFNTVTLSSLGCYMSVWIICQLYVIKKKAINMVIKL